MKMRTHFTSPSATIKRLSCSSLLATLFGLAIFLLFPAIVSAHAEYVSSDPAANAVLKNAPTTITIHFSEGIDPKSTILVYDAAHNLVSQPAKIPNNNDLKTMAVALQPNGSELYLVNWYTISADDGHTDAGSFRFFVNPSSDLTDAVHANNTSGQTNTSTTTSTSGGLPVWSAFLIGVVALLVGGLIGVFFGGKRLQKK